MNSKQHEFFNELDRISYKREKNLREFKFFLIAMAIIIPVSFIIMQIYFAIYLPL
ncbi:hypothetical protein [Apilactobacillus timberlakei]|uniref:hypothetical protein n=1 Tax=Apilactobacillus timberlakei TaxID=2008380 RepID=UPI0015E862FF|nr:hypothetical protein [Apilactobacillus timberlakei]